NLRQRAHGDAVLRSGQGGGAARQVSERDGRDCSNRPGSRPGAAVWRDFIVKYQDRVLFGTDGNPSSDPDTFWRPHFRFFETFDEYFEHPAQIRTAGGSPGHGRWNISGIGLPDEVLRKVYYLNALKYLPSLPDPINRQLVARGLR